MNEILAPLEAQLVEQDAEHLEVIVLLVAHNIDHLVDGIVLETQFGGTYILRHIDTCAVGTEKELLVETFLGEVCPHTSVFSTIEEAFLEAFLHFLLAFEIGFALVVYLVEADAQSLVGLVETCINPLVHPFPKSPHFRVVLLPFHQHFVGFLDERSLHLCLFLVHTLLLHKLAHFLAIVLIEGHVVITNEMVALLARRFRCFAVSPLQPSQHRLADVDASIVHDIRLNHLISIGLHHLRQSPSEQIIADVTEVKGFVRVGRRVLYHDERTFVCDGKEAELGVRLHLLQQTYPLARTDAQVQEAFHGIEAANHFRHLLLQTLSNL